MRTTEGSDAQILLTNKLNGKSPKVTESHSLEDGYTRSLFSMLAVLISGHG